MNLNAPKAWPPLDDKCPTCRATITGGKPEEHLEQCPYIREDQFFAAWLAMKAARTAERTL